MSGAFPVTVERVGRDGASVCGPAGPEFIAKEELSWSQNPLHESVRSICAGQVLRVVRVPGDTAGTAFLSHRRAVRPDPWMEHVESERLAIQQEIEATIYSVERDVAWGETDENVGVRIERSGLPLPREVPVPDVLFSGDRVRGRVTGIDSTRHQIVLDIASLYHEMIERLGQESSRTPQTDMGPIQPAWKKSYVELYEPQPHMELGPAFSNTLVLDDLPEVAGSIAAFIRSRGGGAWWSSNIADFPVLIRRHAPTLVIIDFSFSGGKTACDALAASGLPAGVPIVIVTALAALAEDIRNALRGLGIWACFEKPIDFERLDQMLRTGRPAGAPNFVRAYGHEQIGTRVSDVQAGLACLDCHRKLSDRCQADLLALLSLNTDLYALDLIVQSGTPDFPLPAHEQKLKYSRLLDVLLHRRHLFLPRVADKPGKGAENLFTGLGCTSALGTPVDLPHYPSAGIFAFRFQDGNPFTADEDRAFRESAADLARDMQVDLENERLGQSRGADHRGQLAMGFLHEVKNLLEVLIDRSDEQRVILDHLLQSAKGARLDIEPSLDRLVDLSVSSDAIRTVSEQMSKIAYSHLSDSASDQAGTVALNDLVNQIVYLCRPLVQAHRFELCFRPHVDVGSVLVRPIEVSQILYNLILNAIEHDLKYRESGKPIVVRTMPVEDSDRVAVEVQDVGSGVHARHQTRIFTRCFTTKHRGSGLGLGIARDLAERSMGGSLILRESCVLLGSTFRLEIPAMVHSHGI